MVKLVHGGDIYSARERIEGEIIDFSANLNPLGLPDSVRSALCDAMDTFCCYPDPLCRELVEEIAKNEQVDKKNILCGNGAADLIFRVVWAIRPKNALVAVPTFAEYQLALNACGCHVEQFMMKEEQDFTLTEEFLSCIRPETDLVFLCNPNNPTGQLIDRKLLERILVRCAACGTMLVVDECFRDFLDNPEENSMKLWVDSFPNLMILRAFTKHYAMAGLRLGYCLCANPPLLERMNQCGQPWSVSVPAQVAGVAALKDTEYLQKSLALIREERTYLKEELKKLDIRVIGSHANYLFFRLPDSKDLKDVLEQDGILIRSCANYPGLNEDYYRIAVKKHEHNQKLIEALERYLKSPVIEPIAIETVTVRVDDESPCEKQPETKSSEQNPTQTEEDRNEYPKENHEPVAETSEEIPAEVSEKALEEPQQAETPEPDACETEQTNAPEEEAPVPKISNAAPPSAEQKKQYRFLRKSKRKYDWEGEDK